MRKIIIVYSPLCEANGAFIGKIHEWLDGKGIEIEECSYENLEEKHKELIGFKENCFINVLFNGHIIDTVPLNKNRLFEALEIDNCNEYHENLNQSSNIKILSEDKFRKSVISNDIKFIPITRKTYLEEMSMCLYNYPRGNPSQKYHSSCSDIKKRVFEEVFRQEAIAGIYAKLNGEVIGLLEVFPREILKKYGFMTGKLGNDQEILTVSCYEVGYGIPRILMIDELMYQLLVICNQFSRKNIEGIGIYEWNDGFNPYWVYEKYGYHKTEQLDASTIVMTKILESTCG